MWKYVIALFLAFMTILFFAPILFLFDSSYIILFVIIGAFIIVNFSRMFDKNEKNEIPNDCSNSIIIEESNSESNTLDSESNKNVGKNDIIVVEKFNEGIYNRLKDNVRTNKINIDNNTQLIPYRLGVKWGFCNEEGKILIDCIYDQVSFFNQQNCSVVSIENNFFLINKQAEIVSDLFDDLICYNDNFIRCKKNSKWGLLNINGNLIIPCEYDDQYIIPFFSYFIVKKGNYGIIDLKNYVILDFKYSRITYNHDEFTIVLRYDGKFGLINEYGKVVLECIYDDIHSFHEGFAAIKHNNKWGFIDRTLQISISCIYDEVNDFSCDLAKVKLDKKWGVIDKTDSHVLNFKYDEIKDFEMGISKVMISGKWGLVNYKGKQIINCKYKSKKSQDSKITPEKCRLLLNNKAQIALEGLDLSLTDNVIKIPINKNIFSHKRYSFHMCDIDGNKLIPNTFEEILKFTKNCILIKNDDKWGVIYKTGKILIEPIFERKESLNFYLNCVDLFPYNISNAWGFVNIFGDEIILAKYEQVKSFSEELAAVKLNSNWGFIDKNENIIIDFKFSDVNDFREGLAAVKNNGLWGLIDNEGNIVIECKFESVENFNNGYAKVNLITGAGLINSLGQIIIDCKYDHLFNLPFESVNNNILSFTTFEIPSVYMVNVWDKNSFKYGAVNTENKIIVPIEYEFNEIKAISEDFLATQSNDKMFIFHKNKGFLFQCKKDDFKFHQTENYLLLEKNNLHYGYIDNQTCQLFWMD